MARDGIVYLILRKVHKQGNQKPLIEEGQTTQWPKENGKKRQT
jgi:hypothetical protein